MNSHRIGRADLHMHTTASDGCASVDTLLNYVAQQRPELDVIAITDHDCIDASLWAQDQQHRYEFDIVPGVEVSSRAGHILALWVTASIPMDMTLNETVQAIHEAGGVAVLAHPFHIELDVARRNAFRYFTSPQVLQDSGVDAIETYNAGVVTPGSNWLAQRFAARIGMATVGGSDAHTLGAIGSGQTCFPGTSAADLRSAIRDGLSWVEGRPWPIQDYVDYLKFGRRRTATSFSVNTISSR